MEGFVNLFENVVEKWPNAAVSVQIRRPVASREELVNLFMHYLDNLSVQEQIRVLKSHPDLAGKLSDQNQLTKESTEEQEAAGLNKLTTEQKKELNELNRTYSEKFGFPFIISVLQNDKYRAILDALRQRLPNTREQEITNGIGQVKHICKLRIEIIVE